MKAEYTVARGPPSSPRPGPRCRVAVALRHATMRSLVRDLLEVGTGCEVFELTGADVAVVCRSVSAPDLLVLDAADFPTGRSGVSAGLPSDRVVVVGPEADAAYRKVARDQGAGAWISRERLGDDLIPEILRLIG